MPQQQQHQDQQQTIEEIMREAHQNARQILEEMIAEEENENNRAVLRRWKDSNLSPAQIVNEIDISIANYLKEVQKADPHFEFFRHEHHRENPEEFEKMLQDLKRKGLM